MQRIDPPQHLDFATARSISLLATPGSFRQSLPGGLLLRFLSTKLLDVAATFAMCNWYAMTVLFRIAHLNILLLVLLCLSRIHEKFRHAILINLHRGVSIILEGVRDLGALRDLHLVDDVVDSVAKDAHEMCLLRLANSLYATKGLGLCCVVPPRVNQDHSVRSRKVQSGIASPEAHELGVFS